MHPEVATENGDAALTKTSSNGEGSSVTQSKTRQRGGFCSLTPRKVKKETPARYPQTIPNGNLIFVLFARHFVQYLYKQIKL